MDNIAELYVPLMQPAAGDRIRNGNVEPRLESMFMATLLRASHLFGLTSSQGNPASGLWNEVLPQILANDLLARHHGSFGQMALTARGIYSGGP